MLGLAVVALSCTGARWPQRAAEREWRRLLDGIQGGISGTAFLAGTDEESYLVVVHDNKEPGERRVGVVTAATGDWRYQELSWPAADAPPVDLEAIAAVPETPGEFLALTSWGRLFRLSFAADGALEVASLADLAAVSLPDRELNFEGLAIAIIEGRMVALWGHRGAGPSPGLLFWGVLDPNRGTVANVRHAAIVIEAPATSDPDTRHFADLRIESGGAVWAVAANDPGDNGPFRSKLYRLGTLAWVSVGNGPDELTFEPCPRLVPLRRFPRKVEAIEWLPDRRRLVVATDDENDGGWISIQRIAADQGCA